MPALAVDQDERLVGAEAAQRRRVDVVRAIRAGLAVGVERGRDVLEQLVHVEAAGGLDELWQVDDVDGHGRFDGGAVDSPRADDLERLDRERRFLQHHVLRRRALRSQLVRAVAEVREHDHRGGRAVAQLVTAVEARQRLVECAPLLDADGRERPAVAIGDAAGYAQLLRDQAGREQGESQGEQGRSHGIVSGWWVSPPLRQRSGLADPGADHHAAASGGPPVAALRGAARGHREASGNQS